MPATYSAEMEMQSDSVSFLESKDQTCGLVKSETVLSEAKMKSRDGSLRKVYWVLLLRREGQVQSNSALPSP